MIRAIRESFSGDKMNEESIPQDSLAAGLSVKPTKFDEKLGDSSTITALTQRVGNCSLSISALLLLDTIPKTLKMSELRLLICGDGLDTQQCQRFDSMRS